MTIKQLSNQFAYEGLINFFVDAIIDLNWESKDANEQLTPEENDLLEDLVYGVINKENKVLLNQEVLILRR